MRQRKRSMYRGRGGKRGHDGERRDAEDEKKKSMLRFVMRCKGREARTLAHPPRHSLHIDSLPPSPSPPLIEEQHRLRVLEASKPSHLKGSKAALAAALEGKLGSKLAEAQRLGGVRLWDAADGKGLFPKEGGGGGGGAAGGRKAQPKEREHAAARRKRGGGAGDDEHDHEGRVAADVVEDEDEAEEEQEVGARGSDGDGDGDGDGDRDGDGDGDGDGAKREKREKKLSPGTVRGGWRWNGSLWKVLDRRAAGVSEAAAAWFERRTVQERLPFDRFIDCARHAAAADSEDTETASSERGKRAAGGKIIVGLEGMNLKPLADNLDDVVVHRGNRARLGKGSEAPRQERIANALRLPASGAAFVREGRWGSCALVGSSGSLRSGPAHGAAIDSHDVVVRLNQAPTWGYARWVGSKTSHRVLNRLWTRAYRTSGGVTRGMALPLERDVSLLVTRATGQEYETLRDHVADVWRRRDAEVLYMSSRAPSAAGALLREHRARSCAAGVGPHAGLNVPSSGLVAAVLLTHLCRRVDVYGLGGGAANSGWGGDDDKNNHTAGTGAGAGAAAGANAGGESVDPYHYYKGGGARAVGDDVHCFECEEALLRQLHREGHITFCGGGGGDVSGSGGRGGDSSSGSGDEACGCTAPKGREHECVSAAAAAATTMEEETSFKMDDVDRDRMRRVFERAERDKRKERERNVKREGNNVKSAAASQGTTGGATRVK